MNVKKMYLVNWGKGFGEAFTSIVTARKIALVHYKSVKPIQITDFNGKVIGAVYYLYGDPVYSTMKKGKLKTYRLYKNGTLGNELTV